MQAIQVKFLSPTDKKGARIKAWSYSGKQVTLDWDYGIHDGKNYANAAMELLKKLNWDGIWFGGELPNNDWAFVCYESNAALVVGVTE